MLDKKIKEMILKESNLDTALAMLEPYKNEKWDKKIIKHLQQITPEEENKIEDFSYLRKNNN